MRSSASEAGLAAVAPLPATLLVAGLAAGFFAQGGFFLGGRLVLTLAVAAAAGLALLEVPPGGADLTFAPVVAAAALAAWAVLRGMAAGATGHGLAWALLLAGMGAVVLVCRRLPMTGRETMLFGLIGIGVAIAITGWLGVAAHVSPWARPSQGLWRASSTLTYANAAAAVLVMLSVVALGLLCGRPGHRGLAVCLTALLTGLAGTLSRAGLLALLVGLAVLAGLTGYRGVVRALTGPALGACVALAALLPSVPVQSPPRPLVAGAGLMLGMALAAWHPGQPRRRSVAVGGCLAALAATAALLATRPIGAAVQDVARVRLTLDSTHRADALHAALRLVAADPLTGTGPGLAHLRWVQEDGTGVRLLYAHDEYLQTLVELGAIGLALLLALLGTAALVVLRRPDGGGYPAAATGAIAALGALAVHSAFDFVWHVPVIPLTAAALLGLVCAPLPESAGPSTRSIRRERIP
jgi:O-antigen ligase